MADSSAPCGCDESLRLRAELERVRQTTRHGGVTEACAETPMGYQVCDCEECARCR